MTTKEPNDKNSSRSDATPAHQRQGSLLRTVRAVAWSMIGLRKGAEYQKDIDKLNPIHIIVVGLLGLFLLVIGLIALVNWIV
ncbi:DUF2970 domain-containing protein [Diaphorobacter sp. HDW4A]|uniref:DUF2970 domain-containing protein n=1 Tax=Diaphorobacter sp. HDW4A TaxID=2714924 RepID=UPI00140D9DAB|nr:DUF2970 domain-containing protein [Diaphorobacter sp. HDW4A]QIL84154.1 DUF2970 domain-containing protein [Diaphorobacter sp. HDW4A]